MAIKVVSAPATVERTRRVGETEHSPLNRIQSDLRVEPHSSAAAELEVSRRVKNHLRLFNRALQGVNDEVSVAQSAREGLVSISQTIERVRERARRARDDTTTEQDRAMLRGEAVRLLNDVEETATRVGLTGGTTTLDIPARTDQARQLELERADVTLRGLGFDEGVVPSERELDRAVELIGVAEDGLARSEAILETAISELQTAAHNAAAARSTVARAGTARGAAHLVQEQIDRAPGRAVASQTVRLHPGVLNIME